ncbi:hypothetical protein [Nonomuraea basaltis]|uniref:hypothetical protein n=1 Tax=Nonomuraea basaltis TaxID=2495887 RepID=UPI00110C4A01|nr:hypothetical protein [Nonomuraea basaltis]TMR97288.1 hypothetical protein EJK15_18610 [Nonomuraea basaltis]
MTTGQGRTPTSEELADARRSAKLAAGLGAPLGVCPYDPRNLDERTLAVVWAATYADALPDNNAAAGGQEEA